MCFIKQLISASFLWALVSASPVERRVVQESFTANEVALKPLKSGPSALMSTYMKFNKDAPADVVAAAAANDGTVAANPAEFDSSYLTPVTIGGQTLMLDFDTGSADLWVFSSELPSTQSAGHSIYDPSRSSGSKILRGYEWRITYGDGSGASGNVYTDTVQIGTTTVNGQAIELASTISAQFQQDSDNDGLLGLSFDSLNTVTPKKQKTFFDTAKASLSLPIFTADLKKGAPGSYTFGAVDSSKYTGDLTYMDVDSSNGFWGFTVGGYAVGGSSSSSKFSAIADTGTTLLYLPDEIVTDYYGQIDASYDSTQGGYTFACSDTLPDLTLNIGGYNAVVPGSYIKYAPVADSSPTCFGGIQSDAEIGFSIFGDIFLKSQFVVFDGSDSPRIGFAAKPL